MFTLFYSWGKRPNHSYGVVYQVAPSSWSFTTQRLYGPIDMTPVIQARARFKGEALYIVDKLTNSDFRLPRGTI